MGVNVGGAAGNASGQAAPNQGGGFVGGSGGSFTGPTGPAPIVTGADAVANNAPGNVNGPQYAAPGANGVTSYGLFSSNRSAPAGTQPGIQGPAYTAPPPPTSGYQPTPGHITTGRYGAPVIPGMPTSINTQQGSPMQGPPIPTQIHPQGPHPTSRLPPLLAGMFGQQPRNMQQPGSGGMSMAGGQRQVAQAPAPQRTASAQGAGASGDQAQAQAQAQLVPGQTVAGLPAWMFGPVGQAIGGQAGDAANAAVGGLAGDAGSTLGNMFKQFSDAWGNSSGAGDRSMGSFMQNPQFNDGSLVGDVGQNMTSMMDPAAWQQMAQNRLTDLNQSNLAGMNLAQRRMADSAGRTGMANTNGAVNNLYNQYALRGQQDSRNVFNDVLNNQVNAIGQAGNFALNQRGQDIGRWNTLAGLDATKGQTDLNNWRQDHPSGAAMAQDLLGAIGGMMGGASQGGGNFLSMLPAMMMMGA